MKELSKHFFFTGKMFIDGSCSDTGSGSDLSHGGFLIAGFKKDIPGTFQDQFSCFFCTFADNDHLLYFTKTIW